MPDVAGHRVLRILARGDRADLMVGFDDGESVVIKRFHLTTAPADVARELEALTRAAGDHVVAMRDVGSDAGRTCVIFERLGGGDLSGLLRMRGSLEAGEAVTVIAPIAGALARMHAAGVAHGAIAASSILFTSDGSPTLVGFGRAELFGAGSPEVVLEGIPGVASDRAALRGLALSLLGRVPAPQRAAREFAALVDAEAPHRVVELLSARLFEVAAPAPLRFESDEAAHGTRALPVAEPIAEPVSRRSPLRERLELWVGLLEQDAVRRLRQALVDRWRGLAPRSRRILLGAAAGLTVLGIALAASPPQRPQVPAATASPIAAAPEQGPDPALTGDDPVAAAVLLLEARDECLRTASLLCLDGVVQAGSSAEAVDRAAVSDVQAGGEPPPALGSTDVVLVERLGDSALVSLGHGPQTAPASLLLMKGEAGWRIRDYVATPGV